MLTADNELFSTLAGSTHHLPQLYGHTAWRDEDLLSDVALAALLADYIVRYNTRRPHEALGDRTPIQAWNEDPTVVEMVDPALVRHAYMAVTRPRRTYKLSKNGLYFNKVKYTAPEFGNKVGRLVTLRHLPNDTSYIDVYLGDEFLCTAEPAADIPIERKAQIARTRRNTIATLDRILKTGARETLRSTMERVDKLEFVNPPAKTKSRVSKTTPKLSVTKSADPDLELYLKMAEAAAQNEQEA